MTDEKLIEKKLSGKKIFSGRIIDLSVDKVLLPDGKQAEREYVSHRGGASVLPIDNEQNVYLVRQFRYPYGQILLEIPAGKLEKGEDAAITAARELEEETGFVGSITPYGVIYPTPGYTDENLYVFLAKDLKKTHVHLDEDEFVDLVKMPIKTALKKVLSNEIKDAKTCYALLRYCYENGI